MSALEEHCSTLIEAGKDLAEDELLGAIAFAVCVGGAAFKSLALGIAELEGDTLRLAVAQLKSAAQHCFNTTIALWLEKNYKRIVSLYQALKRNPQMVDCFQRWLHDLVSYSFFVI